MSPMAIRKPLTNSHVNHSSMRPAHRLSPRAGSPRSAEERIPPQATAQYSEPAAGVVLSAVSAMDPVMKTVSVKEAAFRLRKSPDSIYTWLRRGRLKGWQPGGHGCQIQVLEASVEQALKHMLGKRIESAEPA